MADADRDRGEGWLFWAALAVAAGVVIGFASASNQPVLVVFGFLAVLGALNEAVTEIRRTLAAEVKSAELRERRRLAHVAAAIIRDRPK